MVTLHSTLQQMITDFLHQHGFRLESKTHVDTLVEWVAKDASDNTCKIRFSTNENKELAVHVEFEDEEEM